MSDTDSLVALGLHIFDIHGVRDGVCACGRAGCAPGGKFEKQAGKHPVNEGAFAAQKHSPSHTGNLGIATGAPSGVFVIDVDPSNGGVEGWAALCAANGGEPPTLSASTGGGGRHLYYEFPDLPEGVDIRNSAGKLAPGVDVRGSGGYVLAPGSTHRTGGVYKWIDPPACQFIERAPQWLIDLVTAPAVVQKPVQSDEFPPADAEELAAAEMNLDDWLAKCPPRAGQGNSAGFTAACFLVRNWALSVEEAQPLFERYTQRTINPRSPEESLKLLENAARYGAEDGEDRRLFRATRKLRQDRETAKKDAGGTSAASDLKGYVKAAASRDQAPLAQPVQAAEFSREVLRAKLARSKHVLVHRLLAGKPVYKGAKHGGERFKGGRQREAAWYTLLTEVSNNLAGETWPVDLLMDLLLPSWEAESSTPEDPKVPLADLEKVFVDRVASAVSRVEASAVVADAYKAECAAGILSCLPGDPEDAGEWLTPHLGADGRPLSTHSIATVVSALRLSSAWSGFAFDKFTQRLFFRGELVDADVAATKVLNWLSERGLCVVGGMKDLIGMVARENAFDSLVDFYDALPAWDGTDRLRSFDRVYLQVEDPNLFTSEACRRWFLALVARAYAPGCQVDTALILRGTEQGERKSTFFASMPFYLDFKFGRTEDEDTRNLIGRHVVEFSELVALKMREREHAKNFLTKRTDKVRRMRADDANQINRRGVFCGTTNLDSFLDDPTGHRRYWPLTVGAVAYLKLREDLPQVLAQARSVWLEGEDHCPREARCLKHRWFIDKDEPVLFQLQKDATHSRTEESQTQQLIQEAIVALAPKDRPSAITARWVFLNVIDLAAKRTDRQAQREVSEALRALCGPEKRRAGGKVVSRHYKVPDVLLRAPQQKSAKQGVYDYVHSVPAEAEEASS